LDSRRFQTKTFRKKYKIHTSVGRQNCYFPPFPN
jgi:hypothetical protein